MDFLPHSLSHTVEQSGTTRQDDVLEQIFSNVHIALLYGSVAVLMNTIQVLEPGLSWSEKNFGGSESLISDKNLSTIR